MLVVSPLLALMKHQVASISEKGLLAVFVSDKDSTPPTVNREKKKMTIFRWFLLVQNVYFCLWNGRICCCLMYINKI